MSKGEGVDWASVFSRAHRRVAIQLVVVATIGAVGAVLLLGGGAATRSAVEQSDAPPPGEGAEDELVDLTLEILGGDTLGEPPKEEDIGEEEGGFVTFVVRNESDRDADEFLVVSSTGEKSAFAALAAGDETSESIACTPGEEVTLTIRDQAYNGAQIGICGKLEGGEEENSGEIDPSTSGEEDSSTDEEVPPSAPEEED